ncbi:MAG: efflux RND transporter permease subunit [Candidatus Eiseniibacteriota bacterium]|jgi:multidrug efflux pump subunit AcrB
MTDATRPGDGAPGSAGADSPASDRELEARREFGPTSFALGHRNSVLVGLLVIVLLGAMAYARIPRESSPEIKVPIYVINTIYTGVAPEDVENLITQPLEDELNTIPDIKDITSVSIEGYSSITCEFEADVDLDSALQKVREKVDLARPELPEAAEEPTIFEVDFSNFPIMQVNVSGEYDLVRLKEVAEELQDAFENIPSVREVSLSGGLEREVQVNVDLPKLKYYGLDFRDVVDAITFENITVPGGTIDVGDKTFLVRVPGEFQDPGPIEDVVVVTRRGRPIYVRDVASVDFGFEDRETFARLDGHPVVTLGITKRTGENIIETADAIKEEVAELLPSLPPTTRVEITSDESEEIRKMVSSLENNIISGLLLVVAVLLFFLGLRNASLAAVSIPLSMLLSYVIMDLIGFTLNMVVLFSLILALGMLVDNAVVVVENIYRYRERGIGAFVAARKAVGEVAMPVVAATLTTLAAFFPMTFWPGIVGEFMKFLPLTLIITLSSSLFVALVIVPVLCSLLMRVTGTSDSESGGTALTRTGRIILITLGALIGLGVLLANPITAVMLLVSIGLFYAGFRFLLNPLSRYFQERLLPAGLRLYERQLRWALAGARNRTIVIGGTVLGLFVAVALFVRFNPGVVFFPEDVPPAFAWVQLEAPVGTRVERMDAITRSLEARIDAVEGRDEIKSVVSTVGSSANMFGAGGRGSHLATIAMSFIDYQDRQVDALDTIETLREDLARTVVGADIRIDVVQPGPPTGRPVELELTGEDFDVLRELSDQAIAILKRSPVYAKLDGLESDLDEARPELQVHVDRERAALYGLNTQDVGWTVRSAVNGVVASEYRYDDDELDIRVRLAKRYRDNLSALGDLDVMNDEGRSVPLSSVASWEIDAGLGGINHKDLDRVATVSADVRAGYNDNAVVAEVRDLLAPLLQRLPDGYEARFGGSQEEQAESEDFLSGAFLMAVLLIAFVLVSQFNSIGRPLIILCTVVLSTIGVLIGLVVLRMPFGIIMTGVGVIALAGIVVNNAIVLIDYIELLRRRDGLEPVESLVQGGLTRFRPVLLTAITTIGGMIPLAVGLNFDYIGLFTSLAPDFYWGGESASWWGSLAIAVICGLTFATFLTLVVVPVMVAAVDDFGAWAGRVMLARRREGSDGAADDAAVAARAAAASPAAGRQA